MKLSGIILIIAGILIFAFHVADINKTVQVAKLGPLEINEQKEDKNRSFTVPVVIGTICILTGSGLLVARRFQN